MSDRQSGDHLVDGVLLASLGFEETYRHLARIVDELDAPDISLERSLALYELGSALAQHAESLLNSAELRIRRIESIEREASSQGSAANANAESDRTPN